MNNFSPGIDIVDINRFKKVYEDHGTRLLEKIFCPNEIQYCLTKRFPCQHLAARFAAKEAVKKSFLFFSVRLNYSDIQVVREKDGYPSVNIRSSALPENFTSEFREHVLKISISHTEGIACAFSMLFIPGEPFSCS